jgi:obg-like ATPase 1
MGIVGLPNVGKSTFFNLLCDMHVPAENFPFCTIDPSVSKVPVPDERFDHLVSVYKPKSVVPAVLTVTDIAGLVKGASEGAGLGNAFLSNIQAVDGIFHVCRAFAGDEITHVEGRVDPVEDLGIIHNELRLKDIGIVQALVDGRRKNVERGMGGKEAKEEFASLEKCLAWLLTGKDVRQGEWTSGDVDALNKLQLLTAKPMVYLVNLSEKDFARKGNKWLEPLAAWVKARGSDDKLIPFSCEFEAKLADLGSAEEKEAYCKDLGEKVAAAAAAAAAKKAAAGGGGGGGGAPPAPAAAPAVRSMMPRIIKAGYHALHLSHYFTAGPDEVRAWTIKVGSLAPNAAGVIHTDFLKNFIAAEGACCRRHLRTPRANHQPHTPRTASITHPPPPPPPLTPSQFSLTKTGKPRARARWR